MNDVVIVETDQGIASGKTAEEAIGKIILGTTADHIRDTAKMVDSEEITALRELVKNQQEYGSNREQRVVCAACRWPDGHIILGIRHFSPDMRLSAALQGYETSPKEGRVEQGFVDQYGVFLTRQEAFKIALSQRQYAPYEPYNIGTLYSEDLY